MPYQFNGTDLILQPESGQWQPRRILGIDGNGHAIYPPTRSFELKWGFMALAEVDQLHTYFLGIGSTGTVVATLPKWNTDPYTLFAYSGCVLQEPELSMYDNSYVSSVRLLVTNIRT
jgi:hypothetical protein